MLKKVYIETTIPSFYYNQRSQPEMVARMNWTRDWWDNFRPTYDTVTSVAVMDELRERPHPQQTEKIALLRAIPCLPINQAVLQAAEVYIARKVMPADVTGDALHLAFASVHACDVLLTWNCLHLANANKFEHIRRVNTDLGLAIPLLLTPLELMQTLDSDETGS